MLAEPRGVAADFIELALQRLRAAHGRFDEDEMQEVLRIAVPEFSPLQRDVEPASATIVAFPAREARRTR
jgi:plasmid stability protein